MSEVSANETARAVWAAFEARRHLTLDELEELTEMAPGGILRYLNSLIRGGFVSISGAGTTLRGEYLPRFSLINLTGPRAPYLNETGQLIDPNLARQSTTKRGRNGSLHDNDRPPSPSALLVAAARRLNKFTRAEILEATGLANLNAHSSAYLRGLSARGWLYRLDRNEWRVAGTPPEAQIVEKLLTDAAGKDPIDMIAAHRKWGSEIPQRTIGFVVDVMRAEGWTIRKGPGSGKTSRMIYQVEKRA